MEIRRLGLTDDAEWLRMRDALWRGRSEGELRAEMVIWRENASCAVFVADRGGGRLGGFLELGERSVADGCDSSPVAYIEGWYVDADLRRTGVGKRLVSAAERYAIDMGRREIASDCVLNNDVSLAAHLALGYGEVDRLIHFRKALVSGCASI
jgi:aminoglycoside 6'-N-acetyltransferase I